YNGPRIQNAHNAHADLTDSCQRVPLTANANGCRRAGCNCCPGDVRTESGSVQRRWTADLRETAACVGHDDLRSDWDAQYIGDGDVNVNHVYSQPLLVGAIAGEDLFVQHHLSDSRHLNCGVRRRDCVEFSRRASADHEAAETGPRRTGMQTCTVLKRSADCLDLAGGYETSQQAHVMNIGGSGG